MVICLVRLTETATVCLHAAYRVILFDSCEQSCSFAAACYKRHWQRRALSVIMREKFLCFQSPSVPKKPLSRKFLLDPQK